MAFDETTIGHGMNLVFEAGTLASETDISTYIDSVDWPDDTDEAQAPGTGGFKHWKAGQRASTVTVTGTISTGATDAYLILIGLLGVEGKSYLFGPIGSTGGQPKKSALGFCKSISTHSDVNGVPKFTAAIRLTGTITDTTW